MAFFSGLMNGVRSYWGYGNGVQANEEIQLKPEALIEVYKEQLSTFAGMSISRHDCISNCIKSVERILKPADCDLSLSSQKVIESCLEDFNKAVDETSYLTIDETQGVKTAFKSKVMREIVEKMWIVHEVESFYPILLLSNEDEQVAAAQKWTAQYFIGLAYFNHRLTGEFVGEMQGKTSAAARNYLHDEMQKKMAAFGVRMEKDPMSFATLLRQIESEVTDPSTLSIAKKDLTLFSTDEKECIEVIENTTACVTMDWPDIKEKLELLKMCIWNGFTLRDLNTPIPDSAAQRLFIKIFQKWRNSQ